MNRPFFFYGMGLLCGLVIGYQVHRTMVIINELEDISTHAEIIELTDETGTGPIMSTNPTLITPDYYYERVTGVYLNEQKDKFVMLTDSGYVAFNGNNLFIRKQNERH